MKPIKTLHHGYTLVEIAIVATILVIIGIAALIAINPMGQIFKAQDTRRRDHLNSIKIAFENYYSDKGCYPPKEWLNMCGSNILEPYLKSIPCDPTDNTGYKIKVVPDDGTCVQGFAVYASMYSVFTKLAKQITACPKTFVVYSENMTNTDIIQGCSGIQTCVNKYGCKSGVCTLVAVDIAAPCRPSYCDSDCGSKDEGFCAVKNRRGRYTNECVSY